MALRAVFIGINKHADSSIHELTGATKDAKAIWALFKDSVDGLIDTLLLDESATATAIRAALDASLGSASDDDTVIVVFAGHGTPGHRLVPFDADRGEIDNTTIPMQEIAERLRTTKARASIVILDCCFSGGAPARVVGQLPVPRCDTIEITDLGGDGRVVIAASMENQEALEFGQHGLFTAALLRVIQDGPGWKDIGVLMEEVVRQVRAEAARSGHEQTPVWAGLIEGGIELPPLRPGPLFAAEFPNTSGIRVGADLGELAGFGIPSSILGAWQTRFSELNSLQLTAVNNHRVLDGEALLVVAPTTSGKTFIGELAAARAIVDGRKAVFLLPFKALANEKYEEFRELYGNSLGLRILRCTGDYADQTDLFVRGQYDLALLTYEMFLGLSVASPALLAKIGLVVLDEAQFITDPTRGIGVELLLTNLLAARERGIDPQIVALSAVIGDANHFDQWLGCRSLMASERPVPLLEGVLDRQGMFQFLDAGGEQRTERLLEAHEIVRRRQNPSSQDVIVPLVRKLVAAGEQVLVFRNKRGSSSGCARYLATELNRPPATEALEQLPNQDLSSMSQTLRDSLKGGVAFHTSDLSREERVVVERTFRDREGPIRALVATSTVAAGVNTPVETVIIVETEFPGRPPREYSVAVYKNMAGRAGRLGFVQEGRSILLAGDSIQRSSLFQRYVLGQPEPIRSSFDPRELDTWILRLLAQVEEVPRESVVVLLANTYAGYLEARASKTWENGMRADLEVLLTRMLELGLLEEELGLVRLSLLGRACGKSHLTLRSAMRLVELLRTTGLESLTAGRLLALIHTLPEFDETYTPLFRRGQRESVWQREVAALHGRDVAQALQRGAPDRMGFYARCKRVAVIQEWINGTPVSEIESTFTVNPFFPMGAGDIRSIADFARFHLSAAYEIADVLLLGQGPEAEEMEKLLSQLEVGIPQEALGLLDLPIRLGRGTYLALMASGFQEPEDVWAANTKDLRAVVGDQVAGNLKAAR